MLENTLDNLREKKPLVHNITNYVTVNDVANAILAIGASPIMSDEPEDVEEITSISHALNINIGTLNSRTIASMFKAGKRAKDLSLPIVLDPVGAGASKLRTKTALDLIDQIDFKVIKGNISEIKTLALGSGLTRGVDASQEDEIKEDNLENYIDLIREYSKKTSSIIIVTGPIDLISSKEVTYLVRNGRPEMGSITGTGCMLSGILAAFLAANPEDPLTASLAAVVCMGLAGELAYERMGGKDGNSSYRTYIIDALYNMTGEKLERGMKIELKK